MITEDYVSFEVAKLLKEKGFDGICGTAYEIITSEHAVEQSAISEWGKLCQVKRPTLQMAMKWLREVHNIYISISHRLSHNADNDVCFSFWINEGKITDGEWLSYEEACENAIRYVLENLI